MSVVKKEIIDSLKKAVKEVTGLEVEPKLEQPAEEIYGDYSSNIALTMFPNSKLQLKTQNSKFQSPLELSEKIVEILNSKFIIHKSSFSKAEAVKPGFINLWLSNDYLINQLEQALKMKEKFGTTTKMENGKCPPAGRAGKMENGKVMVEFAHPNTHKAFHIGHLRNISIGESLVRLLEATGQRVVRANYQGDVGMHIAKAIYALFYISPFKDDVSKVKDIHERVEFLGKAYTAGSRTFEENKEAKKTIKDINYLVYASAQRFWQEKGVKPGSTDYLKFVQGRIKEVDKILNLWKETRQWSLCYFETIYKRVYARYDRYYFESECLVGVDLAKEAVKKGVLQESEGAIIFDGKSYGLDTRVFVNSLGLPTYEAKELALAEKEFSEFGNLSRVIHVVGPEQSSFFKVTFKVEELLDIEKYKDKQYHLVYGWVRLKHGKMSSRAGNVVLGEWLLDEAKTRIKKQFPEMGEETAEKVAVGTVKYSMLRFSTVSDISFSFDESISLEGNSGPYIQYTYARTQSVLRKALTKNVSLNVVKDLDSSSLDKLGTQNDISNDEMLLLRILHRFPEVVEEAAENFAPNLLCKYLFDLAKIFNLFYQKHRIIDSQSSDFRLILTQTVGKVLKNGLSFLGIEAPERM